MTLGRAAQGTLLTAMAHGLPIVSVPTHHAVELLSNSRGLIVQSNDNGTALADALNALLGSTNLRSTMVQKPARKPAKPILSGLRPAPVRMKNVSPWVWPGLSLSTMSTAIGYRDSARRDRAEATCPMRTAGLRARLSLSLLYLRCCRSKALVCAHLQGSWAQAMVKGCTWETVALQCAALVFGGFPAPMGEVPFSGMRFREPVALWRETALRLLSGHARNLL